MPTKVDQRSTKYQQINNIMISDLVIQMDLLVTSMSRAQAVE